MWPFREYSTLKVTCIQNSILNLISPPKTETYTEMHTNELIS